MELVVKEYNINHGLNQKLLKKCSYLNDYSKLVGKVKEVLATGLTRRNAISKAVKFCIANGIMEGYLEFHAEEVFNMLVLQWDKDVALQVRFADGYDDGKNNGIETVVLNMLKCGKNFAKIHADTDLPLQRIEELAKTLQN